MRSSPVSCRLKVGPALSWKLGTMTSVGYLWLSYCTVRCSLSSMELGMSWKSSPGLLRTFLCSCLRVSFMLLQQHLHQQHPDWCRVALGGLHDVLAHFPWGRDTASLLLVTGSILSISFQWHLENLWALRDLDSIFSRGWLGWCLREKRAQKTLHLVHALQLWASYWSMEGKHVFANASFSSLRGWDLQFSGWRLIWKMGLEDKCYFKVIMKRIF